MADNNNGCKACYLGWHAGWDDHNYKYTCSCCFIKNPKYWDVGPNGYYIKTALSEKDQEKVFKLLHKCKRK